MNDADLSCFLTVLASTILANRQTGQVTCTRQPPFQALSVVQSTAGCSGRGAPWLLVGPTQALQIPVNFPARIRYRTCLATSRRSTPQAGHVTRAVGLAPVVSHATAECVGCSSSGNSSGPNHNYSESRAIRYGFASDLFLVTHMLLTFRFTEPLPTNAGSRINMPTPMGPAESDGATTPLLGRP